LKSYGKVLKNRFPEEKPGKVLEKYSIACLKRKPCPLLFS
jgi:hypothetical protein